MATTMTRRTRYLTGSLATMAVASAITLTAPTAFAADAPKRPCGLAATPAAFISVIHEPVLREVPAVTHQEWRWERTVTIHELEYATVLSAATTETDWTREVPGVTEQLWSRTVIDQAAVPAVPGTVEQGHHETVVVTPAVTVTQFEYVQHQTGNTRWREDGWNAANDPDQGWYKTGNTRVQVLTPAVTEQRWVVDQPAVPGTPAVPEVSHTETTWAASSPGAAWAGPLDSRTVGGGTESTTTAGNETPAGAGWVQQAVRQIPAVLDTVWALVAPAGYTATGESRVHSVSTEETEATSPDAPAGQGWTRIGESEVVVVDQPADTETISEGWTETVQVSPALDATAPCPTAPEAATAGAAGPLSDSTAAVAAAQTGNAGDASTAVAAAAAGTTVLPATGNPASPILLATAIGTLVAGGALVRIGRRRPTS
jgi:hypothetical protein